jgi:hypothetical protein
MYCGMNPEYRTSAVTAKLPYVLNKVPLKKLFAIINLTACVVWMQAVVNMVLIDP